TLAFQQFWLQHNLDTGDHGRLLIMFEEIDGSDEVRQMFEEHVGLRVSDYLELSFMLLAPFVKKDGNWRISEQYFDQARRHYGAEKVDRFLELFAKTEEGFRAFVRGDEEKGFKNLALRFFEQTPLRRTPLLHVPGG